MNRGINNGGVTIVLDLTQSEATNLLQLLNEAQVSPDMHLEIQKCSNYSPTEIKVDLVYICNLLFKQNITTSRQ